MICSEKPLVSIVIPAYNVEKFIPKTLESVLGQTYENLEIIVVNDGSVDKTGAVVEKILGSQSRFPYKVIHKRNEGVSVARNVGIENAKGKYIKFLDGDDWLVPDAIEVLVEACERNDCEIAFGGQDVVTPNGKVLYRYDETYVYEEGLKDAKKITKDFLLSRTHISLNSSIFLMDVIDTNQLRFTKGALFGEDNEFISKFLSFSSFAYVLNRAIASAVFRYSSTTKRPTLTCFHNVGSMKRLRRFFEIRNESELVKILDEFVIPNAFAWTIGNLAFNGYPFTKWIRIGRCRNIREQVLKVKYRQNPTKMGRQLSFIRTTYELFPELTYIILRLAGIMFKSKSRV